MKIVDKRLLERITVKIKSQALFLTKFDVYNEINITESNSNQIKPKQKDLSYSSLEEIRDV